ncbi:conjugal transfer protein [Pseudoclavibacter sp. RFBG4]|uniref:type IV secretory system conjugative DNA transfer family protein n=1 Tax=Pseudoclavibacter sp. RFBG4 TaxID=2080575 RepID=UPI000CE8F11D|nr:type IV secretory system conjugative DNA transfer family protein [Pseudoclavibacter sp. RFBG4]PPG28578.1 conjugal transfer protein [Pseudoclavibacter sp. RFBG4]
MSSQHRERYDNGARLSGGTQLLFVGIGLVVVTLGIVWVSMRLGHKLAATGDTLPVDPFQLLFGLLGGDLAWPGVWGTVVAIACGVILAALLTLFLVARLRSGRKRSRVDYAARSMGRGRDIAGLKRKAAEGTAQRLGVNGFVGVEVGKAVIDGQTLYGSVEDMHIDIWGPRTGKTTSRAIPAILDAPGGVLVTSNKRDVVDATRGVRANVGPVWVFDPQGVANEQPMWWWNPLSYVTDEVKAKNLAAHFANGSRPAGAKTDAFFEPAGKDLLAGLLLAAALDQRPITDVYTWLAKPDDEESAVILQHHDYPLLAQQLRGVIRSPEKQRGGIYGTAMQMAACLTNRQVAAWVNPQGEHDARPHFNPAEFVRTPGTLYSLSMEGESTAGPLVTALTVAVTEAAEELGRQSPGGRLRVPLVGVLDEAANVCRWAQLPSLYSHYGSRGIILMTILQSWSQGVDVWGDSGMRKLWSASNIKVYGGGVDEPAFMKSMSEVIGDRDRQTSTTSYTRGQRTVSNNVNRERIMDVDDLTALPKGRAIVFASGSRPVLAKTIPWMAGGHADAVKESIRRYDPQGQQTITDHEKELRGAQARPGREGINA